MTKLIKILFFRLLLMFILAKPVYGMDLALENYDMSLNKQHITDLRVVKLKNYLDSKNSPLANYARDFVEAADKYELPDWKLVPAITGVESSFGKHIPINSYNAYGWCNGDCTFNNWHTSIDVVTQTLKIKYIDKGADTIDKIAPIYAPPSTTWANKVHYFVSEIDKFTYNDPKSLVFKFSF